MYDDYKYRMGNRSDAKMRKIIDLFNKYRDLDFKNEKFQFNMSAQVFDEIKGVKKYIYT